MESTAKIQLSPEELWLVSNTGWILTKHGIIKKVYDLFGGISELMKNELARSYHLFDGSPPQGGKISKGENYQLLPYIILDYPSVFSRQDIFAVRTMFWWGKFFSITLHLSGHHKARFISSNQYLLSHLQKNNFFVCVSNVEWEHHFGENNYLPATALSMLSLAETIERPFFKVAKKMPLSEWENATDFIMNGFTEIVELLQINFRDDKKDL